MICLFELFCLIDNSKVPAQVRGLKWTMQSSDCCLQKGDIVLRNDLSAPVSRRSAFPHEGDCP